MADGSPAVSAIKKRLDAEVALRSVHEPVWRDCFDYSFPLLGSGLGQAELTAVTAAAKKSVLLDSVSTDSGRILASAIVSGMTPANSLWFGLKANDETDEEKRFFDTASQILWENIHGANFDSVSYENALLWVCAGWFVLYIDEDRERGGLVFEQWPLSECYVSSTRTDARIDRVMRRFTYTAEQCVKEYPGACSPSTEKLAISNPSQLVELCMVIEPRDSARGYGKMAKNLPFASLHYEVASGTTLRESGYHEFPCAVPRWMKLPKSAYAVGPMFDALPDIKELNEIKRLELCSLDLALGGMFIAEDDGVLNVRSIKLGPRKIIIANSVESMKPLDTGADFNVGFAKEESLQAAIRRTLMADQLQAQDGPAMTATEVHARVALIRQQLGSIYGRGQSEYLQPMIERCFGLAYRAGALGRAPRSLADKDFTVKYESPLARAQKLEEVTAIQQLYAFAGQVAESRQSVEIFDELDDTEAMKSVGDGLGVPASVRRKPEDVAAIRQARADAQKEAQQAEAAAPMLAKVGNAAMAPPA